MPRCSRAKKDDSTVFALPGGDGFAVLGDGEAGEQNCDVFHETRDLWQLADSKLTELDR